MRAQRKRLRGTARPSTIETLAKMEGYAEWETITRKGKTGYEKGVRMEKMLIN